jgi:hypothetical protein
MLRLNLAAEPEWLDLGHGVRVRVRDLFPMRAGNQGSAGR